MLNLTHFKGGQYQVVVVGVKGNLDDLDYEVGIDAVHHETGAEVFIRNEKAEDVEEDVPDTVEYWVAYRAIDTGTIYARPLHEFFDLKDGKPRFTKTVEGN